MVWDEMKSDGYRAAQSNCPNLLIYIGTFDGCAIDMLFDRYEI